MNSFCGSAGLTYIRKQTDLSPSVVTIVTDEATICYVVTPGINVRAAIAKGIRRTVIGLDQNLIPAVLTESPVAHLAPKGACDTEVA
jgi:hypothetical protein